MANGEEKGGSVVGEIAKTIGILAGSALMPGFGQAYAEGKRSEVEQQRRAKEEIKKRAFDRAGELAKSGLVEDLPLLQKHLDPQNYESFVAQAEQQRELQSQQTLAAVIQELQKAGLFGGPAGGAPSDSGGIELKDIGITPGKAPRVTLGRPTAEQRRFRGEEIYRNAQLRYEQDLIDQGVDPTQARIAASAQARHVPGAIPTEAGERYAALSSGVGEAPAGLSAKGTEQFIGQTAKRAGEMATSRDLDRPDRISFNNAATALKSLDRLRRLYLRVQEKAGPARGRYTTFKDWAGVGSPEVREFIQARKAIKAVLRRGETGAQAAFAELQQIESRIPGINDSPELFEAGISAAVNDLADTIGTAKKQLEAQRFLVPGEIAEIPEGLRTYLAENEVPKEQAPKVSSSDEDFARKYIDRVKKGR